MNLRAMDARCVRKFRVFRVMFWTQKALALSFALSPIFITIAAQLPQGDDPLGVVWRFLVVVSWITTLAIASMYVRGYFADRQGVPPEPPGKRPDLKLQSGLLIGWLSIICLTLVSIALTHQPSVRDWKFLFLFTAVFFQQLAAYTQDAIWVAASILPGQAEHSLTENRQAPL